ncbi:MAG: hypothetical protein JJ891_08990 [Rhizobiaceae bacterium]|nr:hypothetical protein [Rhizobiaceae bacterium]
MKDYLAHRPPDIAVGRFIMCRWPELNDCNGVMSLLTDMTLLSANVKHDVAEESALLLAGQSSDELYKYKSTPGSFEKE